MATLDDLQTVDRLLETDKILLRQSGTDYSATIDKLQPIVLKPVLDGTVPAAKALSVSAFAICVSAADDPVKTATIENFKLIPGMSISLEIQNGNTANDLKQISAGTAENVLKLNISDTGAHEIRIQNINTHGYKGCFTTGGIYEFIFDGTYWICTNSNISAADQNENATENQSNGDADGQHILLNLLGHREVRHDNDEHEQVVDGQRVFGEPAGIELDGGLGAGEEPDASAEDQRHNHEEGDMLHAFLGGGHMRSAPDDEQVDDKEQREHHEGDDFKCEWGFCHDSLH